MTIHYVRFYRMSIHRHVSDNDMEFINGYMKCVAIHSGTRFLAVDAEKRSRRRRRRRSGERSKRGGEGATVCVRVHVFHSREGHEEWTRRAVRIDCTGASRDHSHSMVLHTCWELSVYSDLKVSWKHTLVLLLNVLNLTLLEVDYIWTGAANVTCSNQ